MRKFRCWKIMMWIILVFLSMYASASTGKKEDKLEKSEKLSKEMMGMIMQYLNFHEFLQIMCISKAYYDVFEGKKVADFLKYMNFFTTPMKINDATIEYYLNLQKNISLPIDIQKKFLATHPIIFFILDDLEFSVPKILCSTIDSDTKKEIETFIQNNPFIFQNENLVGNDRFFRKADAYPAVYHPLTSTLYCWSLNNKSHEMFEYPVYLPRALIFTHDTNNKVHIEEIYTWRVSDIKYEKNMLIIKGFSNKFHILSMVFNEKGYLLEIRTKKYFETNYYKPVEEENKHFIFQAENLDLQYTKIFVYYFYHPQATKNIE